MTKSNIWGLEIANSFWCTGLLGGWICIYFSTQQEYSVVLWKWHISSTFSMQPNQHHHITFENRSKKYLRRVLKMRARRACSKCTAALHLAAWRRLRVASQSKPPSPTITNHQPQTPPPLYLTVNVLHRRLTWTMTAKRFNRGGDIWSKLSPATPRAIPDADTPSPNRQCGSWSCVYGHDVWMALK